MKELFKNFKRLQLGVRNLILVDTCFFIDELEKNQEKALEGVDFVMTSFNIEELTHIARHLDHNMKHKIRHFFKNNPIKILELPVHPGNKYTERKFVESIDSELMKEVHDPSDAVLIASAIVTNSTILTKDKHHLFTAHLENYLRKYNVEVHKELKDIKNYLNSHHINLN